MYQINIEKLLPKYVEAINSYDQKTLDAFFKYRVAAAFAVPKYDNWTYVRGQIKKTPQGRKFVVYGGTAKDGKTKMALFDFKTHFCMGEFEIPTAEEFAITLIEQATIFDLYAGSKLQKMDIIDAAGRSKKLGEIPPTVYLDDFDENEWDSIVENLNFVSRRAEKS